MSKRGIILIIAIAVSTHLAFAQEPIIPMEPLPGWNKIGEVKADFEKETESINVLGENDIFKSIKIKVTVAPVNIDKMIVFYENEEMQEISIGETLVDAESKSFDLIYPSEEIKKISFTYRSEPGYRGKKAHVEIFGLRQ